MVEAFDFGTGASGGMQVIRPFIATDERGQLKKTFERTILRNHGIDFEPVEEIETVSHFGVLRGIHIQFPCPQAKLIRCSRGSIYDVSVDLRANSPSYGRVYTYLLRSDERAMLYVPRGFGHGCLAVEENTQFYYLCDEAYYPGNDRGVHWQDPVLSIQWPIPLSQIVVSEKDSKLGSTEDFLQLSRFLSRE